MGIRYLWHKNYPEEKIPDIFFVNPNAFVTAKEAAKQITQASDIFEMMAVIAKLGAKEGKDFPEREEEEIIQDVKHVYKRLLANPEGKTLIFDTCIHSGVSMEPVQKALLKAGLSDVRTGVVGDTRDKSNIKLDLIALDRDPARGCYPFHRDEIVVKDRDSLYSLKNKDPKAREKAYRLRKEIKKIFDNYADKCEVNSEEVERRVDRTAFRQLVKDEELGVGDNDSFEYRDWGKSGTQRISSLTANITSTRREYPKRYKSSEGKFHYEDGLPIIETWGRVGNEPDQKVITYHHKNIRFLLYPDGRMSAVSEGRGIQVTEEMQSEFEKAIMGSDDRNIKELYRKYRESS